MSTAETHTIDSAYMIEFEHVQGGFRVKDLSGDTAPHTYTPPHGSFLRYYTRYGVWRYTVGSGKWEFDADEDGGNYRPAIIRECGIPLVGAKRMRTEIITNITEGGNDMKYLYHVILFNRKTEKIDYKAYITTTDETGAAMTAAHDYDKYDAKVHKHIVKMIEGSEYEVIK